MLFGVVASALVDEPSSRFGRYSLVIPERPLTSAGLAEPTAPEPRSIHNRPTADDPWRTARGLFSSA